MNFLDFLPRARNTYNELDDVGPTARLALGYAQAESGNRSRFSFAVFGNVGMNENAAGPTIYVLRGRTEAIGTSLRLYGPDKISWAAGKCILASEGKPTWELPTESNQGASSTFTDAGNGSVAEPLTVINTQLVRPNSSLSHAWAAFMEGPAGAFDGYMPDDLDALVARVQQRDAPPPMPTLPTPQ